MRNDQGTGDRIDAIRTQSGTGIETVTAAGLGIENENETETMTAVVETVETTA